MSPDNHVAVCMVVYTHKHMPLGIVCMYAGMYVCTSRICRLTIMWQYEQWYIYLAPLLFAHVCTYMCVYVYTYIAIIHRGRYSHVCMYVCT